MTARAVNTVRIIGGTWRSRRLRFPDVTGLRPSADRVRETLFNWLGQDLSGFACLELFAGSGALGFEAASRGAAPVTLVERDRTAFAALKENARLLGAGVRLERIDAIEFLRHDRACYDVIFVDPPFATGLPEGFFALLAPRLAPGGRVYVESGRREGREEEEPGWCTVKEARAGAVRFRLLERDVRASP